MKLNKIGTKEMCQGPLLRSLIAYTVPIILTGVLQLLFNAADLIVVGRFADSNSVGAVGATGSLTNLIVNLFMGLSVGAGVVVAQGLGARDRRKVHQTVHTAIPLALISGAALMVIGIIFSETFLKMMDTPEEILPLAAVYMRIYFGGMIFNLLLNFAASILRAAGDSMTPMIALVTAGVVNVLFNLFFVIVLHMDVAGVALATAISQAVASVVMMIALMRRDDACRFEWRKMGIHRIPLKRILAIGLPTGIQSSMFSISNVLIQSSINSFGPQSVAGNAAASNLEGFVYTTMHSVNQAVLNFSGQNAGAGNFQRIRKLYWNGCLMTVIGGGVLGVLLYLLGEPLLSIYISDSPTSIAFGMTRLQYVGLPYFLCGLMEVAQGAVRGMGISFSPMIISLIGVCGLRVVWIYTVFEAHRTLGTLFASYMVSWLLVTVAVSVIFFVAVRKQEQLHKIS
ncbi:MAG: MATE family efflux transporter [Clostridia bacterium]|nr:MATE family efflux transporter [Clostridia bacterium]